MNGHVRAQELVVFVACRHLLREGAVLHHACVFHAAFQLQFAPVAAGLRCAQRRDQLRGLVLQRIERRGNRILNILNQRLHFGICARALDFHRARLFIQALERGAQRVEHGLDSEFLGLQGLLRFLRLAAKLLLRQREKALIVGAQRLGRQVSEGLLHIGLHLGVLGLFRRKTCLRRSQFACQIRDRILQFFCRLGLLGSFRLKPRHPLPHQPALRLGRGSSQPVAQQNAGKYRNRSHNQSLHRVPLFAEYTPSCLCISR